MTDPISDMLTQIRNSLAVGKPEVVLPFSKLKFNLAGILEKTGWVGEVTTDGEGTVKKLRLKLKYDDRGLPTISGLLRVSKPGQRIYAKSKTIPRSPLGSGIGIISTSHGLMTSDEARRAKLGGELICQIW